MKKIVLVSLGALSLLVFSMVTFATEMPDEGIMVKANQPVQVDGKVYEYIPSSDAVSRGVKEARLTKEMIAAMDSFEAENSPEK